MPYPTHNRRSLLYSDMDRCLNGLFRQDSSGDNQDSLAFYRRVMEAGIETQLSPPERQIIELRYLRGISAAEASRILGIDRSTANRRLNRALLRLQQFARGCILAAGQENQLFTKCC